jgi:hypothetical protein
MLLLYNLLFDQFPVQKLILMIHQRLVIMKVENKNRTVRNYQGVGGASHFIASITNLPGRIDNSTFDAAAMPQSKR